jgi:ATP-dependent RNA helicase DeaD
MKQRRMKQRRAWLVLAGLHRHDRSIRPIRRLIPRKSRPIMPFSNAHPALAQALADRGYTELTAVQIATIAPGTEARDLLVSAQTGSGKTVAYGLAFAATLLGGELRFGPAGNPLALIVAPTRELAMQVHRELGWLYAGTGARILSCIGGMDAQREGRALEAGCHIVVGTPGRLCDHLARGRLRLGELRVAVLDEADEMLDLGFRDELDKLIAATPAWRRTLLFSATIAREITAMARQFQQDALRIDTLVRNQPHADIDYRAVQVAQQDVEHAVVNVLRYFEAPTALVFCATRDGVRHLHASLQERGFTSVALSGELTQNERTRALQAMRDGQARVCVATDVAARGLDLPDLALVLHADLPTDRANLLHRSGRTGRAGRKGTCILIVPTPRVRRAEALFAAAGIVAQWSDAPTPELVRTRDGVRLMQDPTLTEELGPEDLVLAQSLLEGRTAEEIAGALVRLYRSRLPAPEELADPQAMPERRKPRAPVRGEGRGETRESKPSPYSKGRPDAGGATHGGPARWFSLNVGRDQKADPKWLIPVICRLGGITKREIGAIRILPTETRFEVAAGHGDAFARLPADSEPRITPATAPGPAGPKRGRP